MVKVVFRKESNGSIIALFPEESCKRKYRTLCCTFEDGHFDADYHYIIRYSTPASEEEYSTLLKFLTELYGDIKVLKRAKITYK